MDANNNPPVQGLIKFLTGPLAGRPFPIKKAITTIGRDPSNDIVVEQDPRVSRYHARLLWNNGKWSIENVSQKAQLTVNQQSTRQAVIQNNAIIGLGADTSFVFFSQAEPPIQQGAAFDAPPVVTPQPVPAQLPIQQGAAFDVPPVVTPQPVPAQPPIQQGAAPDRFQSGLASKQVSPSPVPPVFSTTSPIGTGKVRAVSPDQTQIAPLPIQDQNLPSIVLSSNVYDGKQTHVLDKPIMNIGRDETNEIVIRDRIVSGLHLRIVRQGDQFVLIHPNPDNQRQATLNGLLYQGRKIRGDEQFSKTLANGDVFRIGNENGTLITLTYNDGTGTQVDTVPPVQPIKLSSPEITIGRAPDNKVVLSHPQVSAHHARLVREGGAYRITDLNSTNHVYVNNQITTSLLLKLGDEIRIGPYRLTYEGTKLTQYDESNFIRIDAQNLKKTGNNNAILLNNISISIPPHKFVALVGGSGAGKSTLMNALNGLRPAEQGKVLYNGQDYYRNLAAFSTQIGYVPQDDIVHRDLTVERALYYAAKLRLPSDFTHKQIEQRIKEVLEDVEMTQRRKLLVKKLSGGQRKRVSIALELLANPSVFFLDEPTSGLDPGLDRKMMYLLRKLADKGHTIVLVTHATNNINSCDYVCFLASGGRMAYFGPPDEAKSYFGKSDFTEIYTSLEPTDENPDAPEQAEARFKLSQEYQKYVAAPLRKVSTDLNSGPNGKPKSIKRPKRGNPFKQFTLLSQRNFELLKNDTSTLILLLLQAPVIALLLTLLVRVEVGPGIFDANKVVQCTPQIPVQVSRTNPTGFLGINTNGKTDNVDCNRIISFLKHDPNGITYAHHNGGVNSALQNFIVSSNSSLNAQTALFIVAFIAVLFGVLNGILAIVKEVSIYKRERTVNLGIIPYVFSKILLLGLFALFQNLVLLLIVNAFEPLHQGIFLPIFLEAYITLVLTALSGLLLGLVASAFATNEDSANGLLPFLLIPQVIFAGVEIALKEPVLQTVSVIFPTRWAMVALGSSIGLHSDKLGGDKLFNNETTFHGTLFSTFSQADAMHRVILAWSALGVLIVVLTILVCIGLKRKDVRA
jgi:ABC-type multidrug transport system ATPase subunit/pSer/pThr/pTyr-binding forkhead associated (FHA) protein